MTITNKQKALGIENPKNIKEAMFLTNLINLERKLRVAEINCKDSKVRVELWTTAMEEEGFEFFIPNEDPIHTETLSNDIQEILEEIVNAENRLKRAKEQLEAMQKLITK